MNDEIIGALIALAGVLIGLVVTGLSSYLQLIQATRATFTEAVRYLEQGSQRRNIGIALISQALKRKAFREESLSILVGSAIYLLTESKQGASQHELHNLDRIFDLIEQYRKSVSPDEIQALRAALQRRGGLNISDSDREARYRSILEKSTIRKG